MQAVVLLDFGYVRCPVLGCIERCFSRKLVHYRFMAVDRSNGSITMANTVRSDLSSCLDFLMPFAMQSFVLETYKEFEKNYLLEK